MLRLNYSHQEEAHQPNAMPLAMRAILEHTIAGAWRDYLADGGDIHNPEAFWQYLVMEP